MTHRLRMLDTVQLIAPQDGFPRGSQGAIVEFGADDYALVEMDEDNREFKLQHLDSLIWAPLSNLRSVE